MRFRDYIAQEKILLCAAGILCAYTYILLWLISADWFLRCYVLGGILLIFAAVLTGRYFYYRNRIRELEALLEGTEEGYLCGEMLPPPVNYIERQYFALMRVISHSAITQVEEVKHRELAYREYIEQFVHEVKTPLMAAMLIAQNECGSPKIRHELKLADNQIENILYMAKIDTLEKDIVWKETNLEELVCKALAEEMELLITAGIGAEVDVSGTVMTDPVFFRMVLRQLLVNASKYCKGCKLTIRGDGRSLILRDNGPGIAANEIPRICKKGYVGSAGRKNPGSTGMGLYIAASICEKLCIKMQVESVEGEYTQFIFQFS